MTINPPTAAFPFPTLTLDVAKILEFERWCNLHMVRYGPKPGCKLSLRINPPERQVDCSGFVRYCLWLASGGIDIIKDGSWNEHQEFIEDHFKASTVESGKLTDSILRVAILDPSDSKSGVGHIAFIWNGETIESHGSTGPDRRPWTGEGWQAKTTVYVLTAPEAA